MKKKITGNFSILLLAGAILPLVLIWLVYANASASLNQFAFRPYTAEEQSDLQLTFKSRNFGAPGKYSLMELVDAERGYFAVKGVNAGDTWKVMEEEGNVLLATGISSPISQSGPYLFDRNGEGGSYVDLNAMKVVETAYKNLVIHGSGEYMTGKLSDMNLEKRYVIQTMDREILYQGDEKAVLTSDYGFAILNGKDSGRAMNLVTGEILYETESGWLLKDRQDGIWIAVQANEKSWEEDIMYLMDDSFQTMLDGRKFRRSLVIAGDYICGDLLQKEDDYTAAAFLRDGTCLLEDGSTMMYLDGDYFGYIGYTNRYELLAVNLQQLKGGE